MQISAMLSEPSGSSRKGSRYFIKKSNKTLKLIFYSLKMISDKIFSLNFREDWTQDLRFIIKNEKM